MPVFLDLPAVCAALIIVGGRDMERRWSQSVELIHGAVKYVPLMAVIKRLKSMEYA